MSNTVIFSLIIAGSLFMGITRLLGKQRNIGIAWLLCAALNAYFLISGQIG